MSKVYALPFAIIPEWILDADISDRAVRLFAVLNRHADQTGRAFPGRKRLAKRCRCSVASIDRAMAELVALEAVVIEQHSRPDGSQTSNSYWLWPITPDPPPTQPCSPPLSTQQPPLSTGAAPYRNESQSDENQWNDPLNPPPTSEAEPSPMTPELLRRVRERTSRMAARRAANQEGTPTP